MRRVLTVLFPALFLLTGCAVRDLNRSAQKIDRDAVARCQAIDASARPENYTSPQAKAYWAAKAQMVRDLEAANADPAVIAQAQIVADPALDLQNKLENSKSCWALLGVERDTEAQMQQQLRDLARRDAESAQAPPPIPATINSQPDMTQPAPSLPTVTPYDPGYLNDMTRQPPQSCVGVVPVPYQTAMPCP